MFRIQVSFEKNNFQMRYKIVLKSSLPNVIIEMKESLEKLIVGYRKFNLNNFDHVDFKVSPGNNTKINYTPEVFCVLDC